MAPLVARACPTGIVEHHRAQHLPAQSASSARASQYGVTRERVGRKAATVLVPPMCHARCGDSVPPLVPAPPVSESPTLRNRYRDALRSIAPRV